ncbi:MAG: hypothetical protein ACHP7N_03355 [Caulobacterales bacterium]
MKMVVPAALGAAGLAAAAFQAWTQPMAPRSYIPADVAYGERRDVAVAGVAAAGPHMSKAVSGLLNGLMAAADRGDWATAKAMLGQARAAPNPSRFDLFEIDVVASFVAINTDDPDTALTSSKRVIASPLFRTAQTRQEQRAMLRNAVLLSNQAGDFSGAVALGEKLAASGPMDDASTVALASAYLGDGEGAKARALALKVIDAALAAGRKPDQGALRIVLESQEQRRP